MNAEATQVLPPDAYWSTEWYRLEQELLFARCWNLVGTIDDLRGAGRVLHASVAGRRVVVSDDDGSLGAVGPDGAPYAADCWAGMVFVHLDEDAPPLAAWLRDFPDHIGSFRPGELVEVARLQFEVECNWKLFVENHVDVYHLWYLHERSLADYDHPRARYRFCGPHWAFYEPPREHMGRARLLDAGMQVIGHIDDSWYGSGAHLVFPNVPIASGATFFQTYQAIPRGPTRTTIDLRIRAERGSDPREFLPMTRAVIEHEDGIACERMQAAVRSPRYRVGPLARDLELPVNRFQTEVLAALAP